MDYKDIDYVLAIAEHRSISRAAQALFISQPALSKYLKKLESKIGLRLFERSNNQMNLTVAGKFYVSHAQEIFQIIHCMDDGLYTLKNGKNSRLRIGSDVDIGMMHLPESIADFNRQFPQCEIFVEELPIGKMAASVAAGELNLCICSEAVSPECMFMKVRDESLLIALPETHPVIQGEPGDRHLDIRLLADADFILQGPQCRIRRYADMLLGAAHVQPKVRMTTQSMFTALEFVRKGFGVCFLTDTFLDCAEKREGCVFFSVGEPAVKISLGIGWEKGRCLSQPERAFIQIFTGYNSRRSVRGRVAQETVSEKTFLNCASCLPISSFS